MLDPAMPREEWIAVLQAPAPGDPERPSLPVVPGRLQRGQDHLPPLHGRPRRAEPGGLRRSRPRRWVERRARPPPTGARRVRRDAPGRGPRRCRDQAGDRPHGVRRAGPQPRPGRLPRATTAGPWTPASSTPASWPTRSTTCSSCRSASGNHPELDALNASAALQTVRLVTFVARDGLTEILCGWLKLALGSAQIDNFRSGEIGNGGALIDLEAGALVTYVVPRPDGAGFECHDRIPGRGGLVAGGRCPAWRRRRRSSSARRRASSPCARSDGTSPSRRPGRSCWRSTTTGDRCPCRFEPEAHALFVGV